MFIKYRQHRELIRGERYSTTRDRASPHPVAENGSHSPISLLSCSGNWTFHIILHAVWKLSNECHHLRSIGRPTTLSPSTRPDSWQPKMLADVFRPRIQLGKHGFFLFFGASLLCQVGYPCYTLHTARVAWIFPGAQLMFENNLTMSSRVLKISSTSSHSDSGSPWSIHCGKASTQG